jgi:hypothetical protein
VSNIGYEYKILVGKPVRKRLLGRHGHIWHDNIKRILKKYVGKLWTAFIWLRLGSNGGNS